MLKLKYIAKGPCHFSEVCWVSEDGSDILTSLQVRFCIWSCSLQKPNVRFCFLSSGLCWLLDSLGILVTTLYLMRKYEMIRWIYSLEYLSYMSCSRVKLGDFLSISTVLFPMVVISV